MASFLPNPHQSLASLLLDSEICFGKRLEIDSQLFSQGCDWRGHCVFMKFAQSDALRSARF